MESGRGAETTPALHPEEMGVRQRKIFRALRVQTQRERAQSIFAKLLNRLADEPCKIGWEFFHAVAVPPARWLGSKSHEVNLRHFESTA